MSNVGEPRVVVLVSAGAEWRATVRRFPSANLETSPPGAWFRTQLRVRGQTQPTIFLHGGWGKVAAAASTQYAIDRWSPALLVNLGTCGGIHGEVERGTVLLVDRTLIYDIMEQMGDPVAAMAHYTTHLDLSWLREPLPMPVRRSLLVSADRDLIPSEIPRLWDEYGAIAADWESAAIAYVAARNRVRCLILRGVSDLVGTQGGEVYGHAERWHQRADAIMGMLLATLPEWISRGLEDDGRT